MPPSQRFERLLSRPPPLPPLDNTRTADHYRFFVQYTHDLAKAADESSNITAQQQNVLLHLQQLLLCRLFQSNQVHTTKAGIARCLGNLFGIDSLSTYTAVTTFQQQDSLKTAVALLKQGLTIELEQPACTDSTGSFAFAMWGLLANQQTNSEVKNSICSGRFSEQCLLWLCHSSYDPSRELAEYMHRIIRLLGLLGAYEATLPRAAVTKLQQLVANSHAADTALETLVVLSLCPASQRALNKPGASSPALRTLLSQKLQSMRAQLQECDPLDDLPVSLHSVFGMLNQADSSKLNVAEDAIWQLIQDTLVQPLLPATLAATAAGQTPESLQLQMLQLLTQEDKLAGTVATTGGWHQIAQALHMQVHRLKPLQDAQSAKTSAKQPEPQEVAFTPQPHKLTCASQPSESICLKLSTLKQLLLILHNFLMAADCCNTYRPILAEPIELLQSLQGCLYSLHRMQRESTRQMHLPQLQECFKLTVLCLRYLFLVHTVPCLERGCTDMRCAWQLAVAPLTHSNTSGSSNPTCQPQAEQMQRACNSDSNRVPSSSDHGVANNMHTSQSNCTSLNFQQQNEAAGALSDWCSEQPVSSLLVLLWNATTNTEHDMETRVHAVWALRNFFSRGELYDEVQQVSTYRLFLASQPILSSEEGSAAPISFAKALLTGLPHIRATEVLPHALQLLEWLCLTNLPSLQAALMDAGIADVISPILAKSTQRGMVSAVADLQDRLLGTLCNFASWPAAANPAGQTWNNNSSSSSSGGSSTSSSSSRALVAASSQVPQCIVQKLPQLLPLLVEILQTGVAAAATFATVSNIAGSCTATAATVNVQQAAPIQTISGRQQNPTGPSTAPAAAANAQLMQANSHLHSQAARKRRDLAAANPEALAVHLPQPRATKARRQQGSNGPGTVPASAARPKAANGPQAPRAASRSARACKAAKGIPAQSTGVASLANSQGLAKTSGPAAAAVTALSSGGIATRQQLRQHNPAALSAMDPLEAVELAVLVCRFLGIISHEQFLQHLQEVELVAFLTQLTEQQAIIIMIHLVQACIAGAERMDEAATNCMRHACSTITQMCESLAVTKHMQQLVRVEDLLATVQPELQGVLRNEVIMHDVQQSAGHPVQLSLQQASTHTTAPHVQPTASQPVAQAVAKMQLQLLQPLVVDTIQAIHACSRLGPAERAKAAAAVAALQRLAAAVQNPAAPTVAQAVPAPASAKNIPAPSAMESRPPPAAVRNPATASAGQNPSAVGKQMQLPAENAAAAAPAKGKQVAATVALQQPQAVLENLGAVADHISTTRGVPGSQQLPAVAQKLAEAGKQMEAAMLMQRDASLSPLAPGEGVPHNMHAQVPVASLLELQDTPQKHPAPSEQMPAAASSDYQSALDHRSCTAAQQGAHDMLADLLPARQLQHAKQAGAEPMHAMSDWDMQEARYAACSIMNDMQNPEAQLPDLQRPAVGLPTYSSGGVIALWSSPTMNEGTPTGGVPNVFESSIPSILRCKRAHTGPVDDYPGGHDAHKVAQVNTEWAQEVSMQPSQPSSSPGLLACRSQENARQGASPASGSDTAMPAYGTTLRPQKLARCHDDPARARGMHIQAQVHNRNTCNMVGPAVQGFSLQPHQQPMNNKAEQVHQPSGGKMHTVKQEVIVLDDSEEEDCCLPPLPNAAPPGMRPQALPRQQELSDLQVLPLPTDISAQPRVAKDYVDFVAPSNAESARCTERPQWRVTAQQSRLQPPQPPTAVPGACLQAAQLTAAEYSGTNVGTTTTQHLQNFRQAGSTLAAVEAVQPSRMQPVPTTCATVAGCHQLGSAQAAPAAGTKPASHSYYMTRANRVCDGSSTSVGLIGLPAAPPGSMAHMQPSVVQAAANMQHEAAPVLASVSATGRTGLQPHSMPVMPGTQGRMPPAGALQAAANSVTTHIHASQGSVRNIHTQVAPAPGSMTQDVHVLQGSAPHMHTRTEPGSVAHLQAPPSHSVHHTYPGMVPPVSVLPAGAHSMSTYKDDFQNAATHLYAFPVPHGATALQHQSINTGNQAAHFTSQCTSADYGLSQPALTTSLLHGPLRGGHTPTTGAIPVVKQDPGRRQLIDAHMPPSADPIPFSPPNLAADANLVPPSKHISTRPPAIGAAALSLPHQHTLPSVKQDPADPQLNRPLLPPPADPMLIPHSDPVAHATMLPDVNLATTMPPPANATLSLPHPYTLTGVSQEPVNLQLNQASAPLVLDPIPMQPTNAAADRNMPSVPNDAPVMPAASMLPLQLPDPSTAGMAPGAAIRQGITMAMDAAGLTDWHVRHAVLNGLVTMLSDAASIDTLLQYLYPMLQEDAQQGDVTRIKDTFESFFNDAVNLQPNQSLAITIPPLVLPDPHAVGASKPKGLAIREGVMMALDALNQINEPMHRKLLRQLLPGPAGTNAAVLVHETLRSSIMKELAAIFATDDARTRLVNYQYPCLMADAAAGDAKAVLHCLKCVFPVSLGPN